MHGPLHLCATGQTSVALKAGRSLVASHQRCKRWKSASFGISRPALHSTSLVEGADLEFFLSLGISYSFTIYAYIYIYSIYIKFTCIYIYIHIYIYIIIYLYYLHNILYTRILIMCMYLPQYIRNVSIFLSGN